MTLLQVAKEQRRLLTRLIKDIAFMDRLSKEDVMALIRIREQSNEAIELAEKGCVK